MRKQLVFLCAFVLCGCGLNARNTQETLESAEIEAEQVVAISKLNPVEYTVFVENRNYRLALYETSKATYLGAYILSNPAINYDITRFEEITGKSHALYSYYTSVGGSFPITWLLGCLAQYKTPNIIVKASTHESVSALEKSAREIGEFYVPMFVQLAPIDSNYDPEKYKSFFRTASEIFKEYASNAAIVWTVKAEDVFDCMKYYPGDEYVDWVGISVYQRITAEKAYDPGIMNALDYFYYSFQKTKPIMLSEYAVSHLSSSDSVYRNELAADEVTRMYSSLPELYPRIKAITYMDVNGLTASSGREVRDNFALLEEKEILSVYSAAVDTADYLSRIDIQSTGDFSREQIRSPFVAYKIGSEFFISRATIEQDLNLSGVASRLEIETINGRECVKMNDDLGRLTIDEVNKVITIRRD